MCVFFKASSNVFLFQILLQMGKQAGLYSVLFLSFLFFWHQLQLLISWWIKLPVTHISQFRREKKFKKWAIIGPGLPTTALYPTSDMSLHLLSNNASINQKAYDMYGNLTEMHTEYIVSFPSLIYILSNKSIFIHIIDFCL